jgi:hypothetical protein
LNVNKPSCSSSLLELELELDVMTRKLPVIRDEPPERPGAGLFF